MLCTNSQFTLSSFLEALKGAFLVIREPNFSSSRLDREIPVRGTTLMEMSAIIIIVRWLRVFENYPLITFEFAAFYRRS